MGPGFVPNNGMLLPYDGGYGYGGAGQGRGQTYMTQGRGGGSPPWALSSDSTGSFRPPSAPNRPMNAWSTPTSTGPFPGASDDAFYSYAGDPPGRERIPSPQELMFDPSTMNATRSLGRNAWAQGASTGPMGRQGVDPFAVPSYAKTTTATGGYGDYNYNYSPAGQNLSMLA